MKLWGSIVATLVLFGAALFLFAWYGIAPRLNLRTWAIIGMSAAGLIFTTGVGFAASGEYLYHKNGLDFCLITLGATLSRLSLQLTSNEDLFPGIPLFTSDKIQQNDILLALVFVFSCAAALFTAFNVKAIAKGETGWPNVLSLINYLIGAALLGIYVPMLTSGR